MTISDLNKIAMDYYCRPDNLQPMFDVAIGDADALKATIDLCLARGIDPVPYLRNAWDKYETRWSRLVSGDTQLVSSRKMRIPLQIK